MVGARVACATTFFDIYDEYRLINVSVNFSYLYEEWKRRNNIYLPPPSPPLVLARPATSPGLAACCSFSDGTGILPAIFVVWYLCHCLINWWYETGTASEVSLWDSFCDFWSWAMRAKRMHKRGYGIRKNSQKASPTHSWGLFREIQELSLGGSPEYPLVQPLRNG